MVKNSVEKAVTLPPGISVEIDGYTIAIKEGGKETAKQFKVNGISFKQEQDRLIVVGRPASRRMNALINTLSSHIKNMVKGLQEEYVYRLAMVYSHFPMNVVVKGNTVEINNFSGEKRARIAKIVAGATVTVKGKEVIVKSRDKEAAGQTAANIERATKVKGKDKRIYQDGIFIVEKAMQEKKENS